MLRAIRFAVKYNFNFDDNILPNIKKYSNMNDILDLIHADNVSHSDAASMPNQIKNIKNRIENLNTGNFEVKLPIDGNNIKKILNINNGPLIGKIKNAVQDAWYENPNLTKDQAIEIIKKIGLENQITEIKYLMKIII
jgi:tRNA nucleotidyltransferase/poly(A) polymerase